MKKLLFLAFIILSASTFAQGPRKVETEWFHISGYPLYSIEDGYMGLNGKLGFPLQKGFNFVFQGTYFPAQFQNSEETYDELRYDINIELLPISFGKFQLQMATGFNFGAWRRNFELLNSQNNFKFKKDESMLFGWGINYNYKGISLLAEHKHYPAINRNYVGIGMKILVFENKDIRKYYMNHRRGTKRKPFMNRRKGSSATKE